RPLRPVLGAPRRGHAGRRAERPGPAPRARPARTGGAPPGRGRAHALRRRGPVSAVWRDPRALDGPVRGGRRDRCRRAELPDRAAPPAEVPLPVRGVCGDRPGPGEARRRRTLRRGLRRQRGGREVPRPPAAGPPGASDGAGGPHGRHPDTLGPASRAQPPSHPDVRRPGRRGARGAGARGGRDDVATHGAGALEDVVGVGARSARRRRVPPARHPFGRRGGHRARQLPRHRALRRVRGLRSAGQTRRRDRAGPTITLAHCWAHVRRQYVEAESSSPQAAEMLTRIGELYAAEAAAQETATGDAAVLLAERRARVAPVVEAIRACVTQQRALPQSALGKALAYTTELWPGLVAFLYQAAIPVDNNATERALRGIALGRKNHYGSRSERGTRVAALCYTLLESAKLAGVEPAAYLAAATRRAIATPGMVTRPRDLRGT